MRKNGRKKAAQQPRAERSIMTQTITITTQASKLWLRWLIASLRPSHKYKETQGWRKGCSRSWMRRPSEGWLKTRAREWVTRRRNILRPIVTEISQTCQRRGRQLRQDFQTAILKVWSDRIKVLIATKVASLSPLLTHCFRTLQIWMIVSSKSEWSMLWTNSLRMTHHCSRQL